MTTDSQDLMNRELRFTTTAEERKIIRERLNKLTTLKRGVAMTTLTGKINNNLSKCGCIGNKLNTNNGSKTLFFRSLVHTNDLKLNKELKQNELRTTTKRNENRNI